MKRFTLRSLKTTISYGAGVFLFTFFLIAPISMDNNRNTWIAVYSFVFFIFTCIFLYKQMWKEGSLENRETGDRNLPWFRGLIYSLVGFSPFLLLEIIYFLVYPNMAPGLGSNIFHAVFRCGFGPMYFIIRFLGYKWYAFLLSSVIIPAIGWIGFMAGSGGKSFKDIADARRKDEEDFLN